MLKVNLTLNTFPKKLKVHTGGAQYDVTASYTTQLDWFLAILSGIGYRDHGESELYNRRRAVGKSSQEDTILHHFS